MRVGFQGHLVTATNLGVGNCIQQLAEALIDGTARDLKLVLYAGEPAPWRRKLEPEIGQGVELVALPTSSRFRPTRILWEQLVLPRRIVKDQLDLLHATGYVMPVVSRLPTVLTIFDLLAITHPDFCRPTTRWHYRLLLPLSARRARRVLAPSRAVRDQICEHLRLPAGRVNVVLPGIHQRFRDQPSGDELAEIRKRYTLPRHFVLFAGNLEPKKNLERLVAAFHEARSAGLEGELILAGGRGWGTRFARPRPAEDVRWLGYVPPPELPLLYRLASEVAFPALAEGFGLPVVEAMACGTVVVASAVPAVEESDPEAVVSVEPLAVASIAQGLLCARRDRRLRARLIARGRRAAARFSWQRSAEQTCRIYREVLGE